MTKPPLRSHQELYAWQAAMELVELVYRFTNRFPDSKRFGLLSQLRRACVSVPSNIAEGYGQDHLKYLNFLSMAKGSLYEVETQFLISVRLQYIDVETSDVVQQKIKDVRKLVSRLISGLRERLDTYHVAESSQIEIDEAMYAGNSTWSLSPEPQTLNPEPCKER